jgi:hypothetical protein
VNGNGIAGRVVPSGVTQTAGADAHHGRDEQRNRTSTTATQRVNETHQPCNCTLDVRSVSKTRAEMWTQTTE